MPSQKQYPRWWPLDMLFTLGGLALMAQEFLRMGRRWHETAEVGSLLITYRLCFMWSWHVPQPSGPETASSSTQTGVRSWPDDQEMGLADRSIPSCNLSDKAPGHSETRERIAP